MDCLTEEQILAFAEGRVAPDAVADVEQHVASCADCQQLVSFAFVGNERSRYAVAGAAAQDGVAALKELAAEPALAKGTSIGRYTVLALVGRGGMGAVYSAYDPELDRRVALKLLHAEAEGGDARAQARLLREAQVTAKLSHPNVVVIYETGTFGDSVFIAMEFVEGLTLSAWLRAATRTRAEIMRVFLAAGRGLAAAHAAALIHRDFKPDNVMVMDDGQVRVMDFGLARSAGEIDEPARDASVETSGPKSLSTKLTQTGALLGTPAYMAPEQFAAAPVDARTDQFSFCVALYESLYGARPFAGKTLPALMSAVVTGTIQEPPARRDVPSWLRRVVLRGLATKPDDRHPSMAALLAALERDPTVKRRRTAAAVAIVVVLAAAGIGLQRSAGRDAALCRAGAERWNGVWEASAGPSARKSAIRDAFAATKKSYAQLAFEGVSKQLDAYVARWLDMYRSTCEATHVRGEQSADVLDLRMSCLQEGWNGASALLEIMAHADGTVVDNAVTAAGSLPALDRCANVALLKAVVKPPENAAARARVEALRLEKVRLLATRNSGRCREAEAYAEELLPRVRAEGYLPLTAETLNAAGFLSDTCADPDLGVARYLEAFTAAMASHHSEAAAEAAIIEGALVGDRKGHPEEAEVWFTVAQGLLAQFENHPILDAWLLTARAGKLDMQGRDNEAVPLLEQAIAIQERILSKDNPDFFMTLSNLGNALLGAGRTAQATSALSRAREGMQRVLGNDHPRVGMVANNEGEALNAAHRFTAARRVFEVAKRLFERDGAAPVSVAYPSTGLGIALLGEGHAGEAVAPLEAALRTRVETHAAPKLVGETRFALARALDASAETRARALVVATAARADYAKVEKGAADVAAIDAWLAARRPSR